MSETWSPSGTKMLNRLYVLKIELQKYMNIIRNTYFSLGQNYFIRFISVGVFNTLFGLVIYSFFIVIGAEFWLALLIGTISGTVFNYITVGGYVFRQLAPHHFPKFLFFYILVYFINFIFIEILLIWFSSKIIIQCFLIVPMGILSYFLMANFVFKKNKFVSVGEMPSRDRN